MKKCWRMFKYEFGWWWKRVWEKAIGMRLAIWLNDRHPDWCWAELCVQLGLGWDLPNWKERAQSIETCRQDCAQNGSCWCGKLMTDELRKRMMERDTKQV